MTLIDYPEGLREGGQKLWRAILSKDPKLADEKNPMRSIAVSACNAKDRCDVLHQICETESVMVDNGKGQPVTNPAWVEIRKNSLHMVQQLNALRLPDSGTAKRPQYRGPRGVYMPRGSRSRKVSRGYWSSGDGGDQGA